LFAPVTIDPGAHFTFQSGGKLTVKFDGGALTADAAGDDPIVFEGATAASGYWETIEIESNNPNNVFANVTVRDGGSGDWADMWVREDARVSVTNSTFANSATWGLRVEDGATLSSFADNTFRENGAAGIRVGAKAVGSLDGASTYVGNNADDVIEVVGSDVEDEGTWPATDAPYFFTDNTRLFAPITVNPGAHITVESGGKLTVKESGGALTADARDGPPITFEGAVDEPGHWETIEVESNNPSNVLDNVEIAFAGDNGWWGAVYVRDGARAAVRNSTIRDNAAWGIVVEEGATFDGSNNTYENNGEGDIDDRS